jgi:hypothetical protein
MATPIDPPELSPDFEASGKPKMLARSKELEHEVIVYCKANPQIRIIEEIDVILKQERFARGFK